MDRDKRHPLHDLLMPILGEWTPLFAKWEELRPQILELQRERRTEAMRGDRERKLSRIDKRLAELRAEIGPTQPRERYLWSDGKIVADSWQELVSHWRFLQRNAAWPVGPAGGPLSDDERAGWGLLINRRTSNGAEKIG